MIIGDGIMLGAGGETASIFVTGLSETDTVTATKGSKTLTGKWKSDPNPAFHGLPDGYTQLEYIESTGTQYIDFGVNVQPNIRMVSDVQLIEIANPKGDSIFEGGTYMSDYFLAGIFKNIGSVLAYFSNPSDEVATKLSSFTEEVCKNRFSVDFDTYRKVFSAKSFDGSITQFDTFSSSWPESSSTIIAGKNGGLFRRYSDKIYVGESLVRDCIPSKRNSDSAIGLYDLVNDVFYTNAGTGTFVAGAEVPQTIDGFLINKIKSYGTWIVTATDGVQTVNQNIFVDSAVQYDISLSYVDERLQIWLNGSGYTDESLVGNAITNYGTSLVTSGDFPYYAFDGNSHYIQFPSQTIAPNDFAISLWGYFDGNYSWERFFDFGEGVAKDLWCGHSSTTGNLAFEYQVNSTGYTSNRVSFSSGAWHHIALRGNNSTTTMYVDGASVTSVSNPSVDTLSLANCYLGKSNWNDPYLHGRIADFRLYNTAITEAEIIELYQSGAYVPN